MTDTQLLYFINIVELGSFSDAALELNISQSSISKQIMQLEDELGISLFDRTSRKARLTNDGEELYLESKQVLHQIKHMKKTAQTLAQKGKHKIALLALPVIGHFNFYISIQLFENSHENYSVELEELEEPEMFRRISLGDYDAAITYYNPEITAGNARFYPLVEDEMVLVCHRDDELGLYDEITPEMLENRPVLAMQKYTCINQLYELYLQKHNSHPKIIFRGRPETILVGAEAKRGPALLSRVHTDIMRINNTKLIPFNPKLKGILGIIINTGSHNKEILNELLQELIGNTANR